MAVEEGVAVPASLPVCAERRPPRPPRPASAPRTAGSLPGTRFPVRGRFLSMARVGALELCSESSSGSFPGRLVCNEAVRRGLQSYRGARRSSVRMLVGCLMIILDGNGPSPCGGPLTYLGLDLGHDVRRLIRLP
jgi:hypothetical protein